jgi:hypothetical protein
MHEVVPVMQVAGVLPHSHQQLPCNRHSGHKPVELMQCAALQRRSH